MWYDSFIVVTICKKVRNRVARSRCNNRQHATKHCTTLHDTARHWPTLPHTASNCNTLQHLPGARWCCPIQLHPCAVQHCNTLYRTTIHCIALQYTVCSVLHRHLLDARRRLPNQLHPCAAATHYNTLKCTTTPSSCNILQHTPGARWHLPVQPNQNMGHLSYICDMPYSDFICICDKESFVIWWAILQEYGSFVICMWHAIFWRKNDSSYDKWLICICDNESFVIWWAILPFQPSVWMD